MANPCYRDDDSSCLKVFISPHCGEYERFKGRYAADYIVLACMPSSGRSILAHHYATSHTCSISMVILCSPYRRSRVCLNSQHLAGFSAPQSAKWRSRIAMGMRLSLLNKHKASSHPPCWFAINTRCREAAYTSIESKLNLSHHPLLSAAAAVF